MRGSEGRFGPGRPVLSMPSNPRGYVLRIWPQGKGNGMCHNRAPVESQVLRTGLPDLPPNRASETGAKRLTFGW